MIKFFKKKPVHPPLDRENIADQIALQKKKSDEAAKRLMDLMEQAMTNAGKEVLRK